MITFMCASALYTGDDGYHIYKFSIDANDNISLHSSTYVNEILKIPKIEKHTHNSFVYKLIGRENNILFERQFVNPKGLYFEDFSNEEPVKSTVSLQSAYFVIKVPVFDNAKRIELYKPNDSTSGLEKIKEIILDVE